eukprot:6185444-Pleurochrysis_carterae.AAC.1
MKSCSGKARGLAKHCKSCGWARTLLIYLMRKKVRQHESCIKAATVRFDAAAKARVVAIQAYGIATV